MIIPTGNMYDLLYFIKFRTAELGTYVMQEFIQIETLPAIVKYVQENGGYRNGLLLVEEFIGVLPSSIMPFVPDYPTVGAQVQQALGWGLSPTPPGLVALLFWDGGIFEVCMGMSILGCFVARVDRILTVNSSISSIILVNLFIFIFLLEITRQGELSRILVKYLTKALPLWFAFWWIENRYKALHKVSY